MAQCNYTPPTPRTVADITRRITHSLTFGPHGSRAFYEELLRGELYHMDEPVIESRDFLRRYVEEINGKVLYLSGRRKGTESHSREWLKNHGFPDGEILHRAPGHRSLNFKIEGLLQYRGRHWVDAHVGDRLEDDGGAARAAGVKFIHIEDHKWPAFETVYFT
jgi:hypothetical protein